MKLRVVTFGTLSLRDKSGALSGAGVQPRRLAMLALLARAGDRGVTRDKLLALIWPDTDEERARRAVTQGIYALRQELGSDDALLGIKELRLNPDLVTTDVGDFSTALAAGRLEDAVRLYAGLFLDGVHLVGNDEFERWANASGWCWRRSTRRRSRSSREPTTRAATTPGRRGGGVVCAPRIHSAPATPLG